MLGLAKRRATHTPRRMRRGMERKYQPLANAITRDVFFVSAGVHDLPAHAVG